MELLTPKYLRVKEKYYMEQIQEYHSTTNLVCKRNSDNVISFGIMKDDEFTPLSTKLKDSKFIYFYGLDGVKSALNALYRVSAMALVDNVDKVLGISKIYSRNFVNGGTYANGTFVQESVIYVPYINESTMVKGLDEYQAIFTFHSDFRELSPFTRFNAPIIEIQGRKIAVNGMVLSEDKKYYFSHTLKPVDIFIECYPEQIMKQYFPNVLDENSEYYLISVNSHEWWGLIEVATELIKKYYFNGNSYNIQRKKLWYSIQGC
jgi:hypothetical protein